MIATAVCRIVRAPLDHPETGVRAALAALPPEPGDPPCEPLAAILDPTSDDAAVTQQGVPDWPVLVVTCEEPAQATLSTLRGFAVDCPALCVGVAYATRGAGEPARAWRDSDRTLFAAMQALQRGLFAADAADARRRGPVHLLQLVRATFGTVDVEVPGGRILGALSLELHVRATLA